MGRQKKTAAKNLPIRISHTALRHLDERTGYIAFIHHQPMNAIKVGDAFFQTFDKIAANPFAFRECEELVTKSKMYRRAVCHSWSVIFKIIADEIIILGIIHQSRRPKTFKGLRKTR
ncbi:MAG: type II toxin-antitoxin system RelE/ParE family toxin [Chitinophagaceae bacterium]